MVNVSSNNGAQYEKLIQLLETQLTNSNQQNNRLSEKLDNFKTERGINRTNSSINQSFIWF
nr:hypothetical protein [Heyndrickxia vini]